MNFIEGTLKRTDGEIILEGEDYMFRIPEQYREIINEYNIDGDIMLGIRPEHIYLGEGEYSGKVYVIEPLGRDKIVHIDIGGVIIRALAPGEYIIEEGNTITFKFDENRIHLFNKKTGDAYI